MALTLDGLGFRAGLLGLVVRVARLRGDWGPGFQEAS